MSLKTAGGEDYPVLDSDTYRREVLPRLGLPPIAEDLVEFSGLSREAVRQRAARWEAEKDRDWAGRTAADAAAVTQFYRDSSCYLFAHAFSDRERYSRYHFLIRPYVRGRKVLDYGAGIGCIGLFLDRLDHKEVTLADVDAPHFRFASFRARRHAPGILMHCLDNGPPPGVYDTVICFSTLEHIADWRGTMRTLARSLSAAGCLLMKVDFETERAVDHISVQAGLTPESFAQAFRESGLELEQERVFVPDSHLYLLHHG